MNTQVIGYVGENGTRDVQIPVGHLLEKWPDLSPSILMVPVGGADDDAYPVDSELAGSDLVWHVSAADTAVTGTTKASVRMTAYDGRVALDEPFTVIVSQNLSAGGTPPSPIQPWVDKLAELTPRAEKAADDAAKAANRANDAAQNWESGTAANADKLGGKQPEYYLTPVNLLDNSDFRNPVNQRGQTSYTAAGYTIDRWAFPVSNMGATISENSLVISNNRASGSGHLQQVIPAELLNSTVNAGRAYTFAAKINGEIRAVSAVVPNGKTDLFENKYQMALVYSNYAAVWVARFIVLNPGDSISVEWAALYEGAYTAETLPPYVPKGDAVELAECQRYYYGISKALSALSWHGYFQSETEARFTIPIGIQMRANPTLTFGDISQIRFYAGGVMSIPTVINGANVIGNSVTVSLGGFTNGTGGSEVIAKINTTFALSADL